MGTVRIVVRYDGQWNNNGENFLYEGGKIRGILLPKNIAYEELQDVVCHALDIKRAEFAITMKFLYKMCDAGPPIELMTDSDVQFFISDVQTRNALCITMERKCGSTAALSTDEAEYVKNPRVDVAVETNMGTEVVVPVDNDVMTDEDLIGVDNYADRIFYHYDSDGAHVWTTPVAGLEASPPYRADSCTEKNMESKTVELDRDNAMTASTHPGEDGGCSDSVFDGVKDVRIGDIFGNKEEIQLKMRMLVVGRQFNIRVKKSTQDLLVLACVQKGCKWWLRATKLAGSPAFRVRKYIPQHTCSLDLLVFHRPQATSKLIGHCIKWKYASASQCYRSNDIVQHMKKRYGMTCTYNKAWRAREVAMMLARGSPEQSYSMLPLYCAVLEKKNPRTITEIECDASHRFKYFFMALGGSITGFRASIRPVIAIDGTFLKSKYKGTLFIATCMDGNNQIYPLAFGIGDSENDNAWIWFMTKLRGSIGEVDDIVFISDRNTSIATAIAHSFPVALHGICMYHLGQNMKANCKGGNVDQLFYKAAKAYRVSMFNEVMPQIAALNGNAAEYLIVAEPTKWARCEFDGRRYSIMTTNIVECLNAILKEARHLPIMKLIEHIRGLLQRWFWERREEDAKMLTPMTPWVERKLRHRMNKAGRYPVQPVDVDRYLVIDEFLNPVVNLRSRTCDYKKFQVDQFPCAHALAVCITRHLSCYDYCAAYYSRETLAAAYACSIHPIGPEDKWTWPEHLDVPVVLPPEGRKPRGRPTKKRKPLQGEEKKQSKCSRYGGFGHNRQKCRVPIPVCEAAA